MIEPIVHETFSPTILEFQVPDKFVDMVNLVGDAVLGDDKLSKQWDFSDNLVGKVSKEVKELTTIENAIKAPMLGTLYHAPSPKAKAFIKAGKKVKTGDILFIIEAMKTMNHVPSTADGVVKEICVDDGQPVEFGQNLLILD